MERRNFILAGGALASSAYAFASKKHASKSTVKPTLSAAVVKPLVDSTYECLKIGEACLAHCAQALASGDTSMAKCNITIQNMLASCEAMGRLASYNSADKNSLKLFAKGCAQVCADCKKECDNHASHHAICKQCSEACERCIKACDKVA